MNFEIGESGSVKVLVFEGNMDTNTSPEAEAKINNPTVQEVFDISGFGTILSVKETEDEALSSF